MGMGTRAHAIVLRGLDYVGGHEDAPSRLTGIDLFFDVDGVKFERRNEILGEISWEHVRDLSVYAESSDRVTFPRVWLLGLYAFIFKKHEQHVRLRLADDRGAWVFDVPGISVRNLRSGIAHVRRQHLSAQHH